MTTNESIPGIADSSVFDGTLGIENVLGRRDVLACTAAAALLAIAVKNPWLDYLLARGLNDGFQDTQAGQVFDDVTDSLEARGWPENTATTINVLEAKEHYAPGISDATNIILTGLGTVRGEIIARDIAHATGYLQPVRFQESGTLPITIKGMCHQLIKSFEDKPLTTPTVGFTLQSMGGIMFVEMLREFKSMGYKLPPIAFANLLSTPSGMDTARFGGVGEFTVKTGIGRGPIGKDLATYLRIWEGQNFNLTDVKEDAVESVRQTFWGGSIKFIDSQMDLLSLIDSTQTLYSYVEEVKDAFSPHTRMNYFGPAPRFMWTDRAVNDAQAYSDWAEVVNEALGITMHYHGYGRGHANYHFDSRKIQTILRKSCTPSPQLIS